MNITDTFIFFNLNHTKTSCPHNFEGLYIFTPPIFLLTNLLISSPFKISPNIFYFIAFFFPFHSNLHYITHRTKHKYFTKMFSTFYLTFPRSSPCFAEFSSLQTGAVSRPEAPQTFIRRRMR